MNVHSPSPVGFSSCVHSRGEGTLRTKLYSSGGVKPDAEVGRTCGVGVGGTEVAAAEQAEHAAKMVQSSNKVVSVFFTLVSLDVYYLPVLQQIL